MASSGDRRNRSTGRWGRYCRRLIGPDDDECRNHDQAAQVHAPRRVGLSGKRSPESPRRIQGSTQKARATAITSAVLSASMRTIALCCCSCALSAGSDSWNVTTRQLLRANPVIGWT